MQGLFYCEASEFTPSRCALSQNSMLIIYNHADVICNSTFYKLMLYMPADLEAHDKPHSKFCAHFSSKGVRTIVLCLASMGTLYHTTHSTVSLLEVLIDSKESLD